MNYVEHDFSTFFRYELSSGSLTYTLKNCVIDTFVKEEDPSTSDFVCIFNAIKDNKSSIPLFLYGNKFNGRSRSDMFFIKNDSDFSYVKKLIEKDIYGKLDNIEDMLVSSIISDNRSGVFMFDGFPRHLFEGPFGWLLILPEEDYLVLQRSYAAKGCYFGSVDFRKKGIYKKFICNKNGFLFDVSLSAVLKEVALSL